jgi:hypothetical protein
MASPNDIGQGGKSPQNASQEVSGDIINKGMANHSTENGIEHTIKETRRRPVEKMPKDKLRERMKMTDNKPLQPSVDNNTMDTDKNTELDDVAMSTPAMFEMMRTMMQQMNQIQAHLYEQDEKRISAKITAMQKEIESLKQFLPPVKKPKHDNGTVIKFPRKD